MPEDLMDTSAVMAFLRERSRPVALKELIRHFELDPDLRKQLKHWLEAEVAEGRLLRVKKQLYSAVPVARDAALVTGRLSTHRDGYGFVTAAAGRMPDIFVPPRALGNAVHGDTVRVRVTRKHGGRVEGHVVDVLTRSQERVVGKVFRTDKRWMLSPLDERYHYTIQLTGSTEGLREGQIVNVDVIAQPKGFELPVGRVAAVLGFPDDPEIQYKIACAKNQIPIEFPEEVLAETEEIKPPGLTEISSREDLREQPVVTIDGETARDFDDAISIERRGSGFFLGVHIADVSHYVLPESGLDREALLRGTSVYFPDRAVSMLPEKLSNDICSLKPGEDRLTVSVFMDIDPKGKVTDYRFSRSVIRSRARMTYNSVKKIVVDLDPELRSRHADVAERLDWMLDLSRVLSARRREKGAIDFDLPEAEIEYDVHGEMFDIVRGERNEAHRIIEEFMLLANETVATRLTRSGGGMIYRIHEEPDPFKVAEFARLVREFGYTLGSGSGKFAAEDFQKLAEKLSGKPEERFLSYLMLRSFKQARYAAENVGHFGLATQLYTHFTSPIRRYPDLVVHRLLKKQISGDRKAEGWEDRLEELARQSSDRERKADEAEREIMKWLMAVFMSERLGEQYDGFVSGVRQNGFYVELMDHFVEGFVHVSKLSDDYYVFDERTHRLVGENSGKMFRLGDRVRIVVDKVDRDRHLIDFSPAERALPAAQIKRAGRPRKRSGSKRRR